MLDITNIIKKAVDILEKGGIICYPADTIWGLGCDATNFDAVEKIYAIKKRNKNKSLILLVDSIKMLEKYVVDIPEVAYQLIEYSENPLTIIYSEVQGISENIKAEDNSVGIRVIKNGICKKLISTFKKPIVSTSANISGNVTPIHFSDIEKDIIKNCDFVFPDSSIYNLTGKPSTIIKLEKNGIFKFIRK